MINPDEIKDPKGFVRIGDVSRAININASSEAAWRIRRGPAPKDLYSPIKTIALGDDSFSFRRRRPAETRELFALLDLGLRNGELQAVGLLIDEFHPEGRLIELTSSHWRYAQRSPYSPQEGAKDPFDWALSVGMIALFPANEASPLVLPLVSEAALANFLDAEKPPPAAAENVISWSAWRSEFVTAAKRTRKARTRKGGRPADPVQNKAIWHDVVRRAMAGELAGLGLAEVTRRTLEAMSVIFDDDEPHESTVRRQLEGLFPKADTPPTGQRKRP